MSTNYDTMSLEDLVDLLADETQKFTALKTVGKNTPKFNESIAKIRGIQAMIILKQKSILSNNAGTDMHH